MNPEFHCWSKKKLRKSFSSRIFFRNLGEEKSIQFQVVEKLSGRRWELPEGSCYLRAMTWGVGGEEDIGDLANQKRRWALPTFQR